MLVSAFRQHLCLIQTSLHAANHMIQLLGTLIIVEGNIVRSVRRFFFFLWTDGWRPREDKRIQLTWEPNRVAECPLRTAATHVRITHSCVGHEELLKSAVMCETVSSKDWTITNYRCRPWMCDCETSIPFPTFLLWVSVLYSSSSLSQPPNRLLHLPDGSHSVH